MRTDRHRIPLLLATLLSSCVGQVEDAQKGSSPPPELPADGPEVVQALGLPEGVPDVPKIEDRVPGSLTELVKKAKERLGPLAGLSPSTVKQVFEFLGFLDPPGDKLQKEVEAFRKEMNEWHIADEAAELLKTRDARIAAMDAATNLLHVVSKTWPDVDWGRPSPAPAAYIGPADLMSGEAANGAGMMHAFLRKHRPSLTDGEWKNVIPFRFQQPPISADGLVYDWRLGIADMMRLISQRLLIFALDSGFTRSGTRAPDLQRMFETVNEHYLLMLRGIVCDRTLAGDITVACADVYSGTSAIASFPSTGCYTTGQGNPLTTTCQTKVVREMVRLTQAVRAQMPLFEMRVLLNTLQTLLTPPEPIQNLQIRLADGPNHATGMCLAEKEGAFAGGTYIAAVIEPCAARAEQLWVYDPVGNTLKDDAGRCLTTEPLRRFGTYTPVGVGACDGRDAQKWTYDIVFNIFHSGVNTVLAIPNDYYLPPGTSVVTSESMGDVTQMWRMQEWTSGSGGRPRWSTL